MIEASTFDSEIFGIPIGRARLYKADDLDHVIEAGRQARLAVVFARADAAGPIMPQLAARGVTPLETLVTSTWQPQQRAASVSIREAVVEHHDVLDDDEADQIAAITAEAITTSHFHADQRLSRKHTRMLYAAWAKNDVTGRAQRTLVVREQSAIAGYMTVLVRGELAIIDLIAVAPRHHGKGLGSALLASFLDWVGASGVNAKVGTQSDNRALALYRRFGFVPTTTEVTYHLWLT
jgi:GNAT superfamily N-acetyltransferase